MKDTIVKEHTKNKERSIYNKKIKLILFSSFKKNLYTRKTIYIDLM